jgi:hypothetical protein
LGGNLRAGFDPQHPLEQFRSAVVLRAGRNAVVRHRRHQPETLDFSAVTLDDPNAVPPEYHIFWASKIDWFNPADDLSRHERFRPNTVGLNGTEPPDDSSMVGGANA